MLWSTCVGLAGTQRTALRVGNEEPRNTGWPAAHTAAALVLSPLMASTMSDCSFQSEPYADVVPGCPWCWQRCGACKVITPPLVCSCASVVHVGVSQTLSGAKHDASCSPVCAGGTGSCVNVAPGVSMGPHHPLPHDMRWCAALYLRCGMRFQPCQRRPDCGQRPSGCFLLCTSSGCALWNMWWSCVLAWQRAMPDVWLLVCQGEFITGSSCTRSRSLHNLGTAPPWLLYCHWS